MPRESESEREAYERLFREAERREFEREYAACWLLDTLPYDADLRAYVHASGSLLFVQRQIHRWEREADARLTAYLAALAALKEAREMLGGWRALEDGAAVEVERTRRNYRVAEFRREHARELDDAAHVWAWYNR